MVLSVSTLTLFRLPEQIHHAFLGIENGLGAKEPPRPVRSQRPRGDLFTTMKPWGVGKAYILSLGARSGGGWTHSSRGNGIELRSSTLVNLPAPYSRDLHRVTCSAHHTFPLTEVLPKAGRRIVHLPPDPRRLAFRLYPLYC